MPNNLFIYGTLKPGEANEHILQPVEEKFVKATLKGYTFDTEWEKSFGYPGITKGNVKDKINSYLFSSDNLSKYWDDLDAFETHAYKRIKVQVHLTNNTIAIAFVYIINLDFKLHN